MAIEFIKSCYTFSGLYLFLLVEKTFVADKVKIKVYLLIGWGSYNIKQSFFITPLEFIYIHFYFFIRRNKQNLVFFHTGIPVIVTLVWGVARSLDKSKKYYIQQVIIFLTFSF